MGHGEPIAESLPDYKLCASGVSPSHEERPHSQRLLCAKTRDGPRRAWHGDAMMRTTRAESLPDYMLRASDVYSSATPWWGVLQAVHSAPRVARACRLQRHQ